MNKKILSLLLIIAMIFSMTMVFVSCNSDEEDEPKEEENNDQNNNQNNNSNNNNTGNNGDTNTGTNDKKYSVTLVDIYKEPVEGVIVSASQNGSVVSNRATDASGKVVFDFKNGEYTFTLVFISDEDNYKYDEAKCILTEENSEVTIVLLPLSGNVVELYNDSYASIVEAGTYYVEFSADKPTYFLFTPKTRGRFKISVESDVGAFCGYYGSQMIIYDNDISNVEDREDGAVYMNFRNFNVNSTEYLFGVTGEASGSGYFTIEKVADLGAYIPEELDWTEYARTHHITDFTFPGGTLTSFDVTDLTLEPVYNENDGFYHLNSVDGPVIYIYLTKPNAYTEITLEKICETQHFGRYVYDDNGNFQYKLTYAPMMLDYFKAADETTGVYPLTKDLATAIQDIGGLLGWFESAPSGEEHPFFGATPVTMNSWLFACCYVADD